jgi:glutamine synthetase
VSTAEYIWIDGNTPTALLRSKTKVFSGDMPETLADYPGWVFDGSSTNQAPGDDSDRLLKPVCVVPDPIRGEDATLVLCEVNNPDGTPHESNYRSRLRAVLDAGAEALESWWGFEQEYTFFKGSRPLGFPQETRFPAPQGPYYCGVGADEVYGRKVVEDHLDICLAAGLNVTGINAEVMPGQWEIQIGGPNSGPLTSTDHLWLARWLLYRVGEDHGITATLDSKPVPGDWNGAGMHTNYSTKATRDPAGGMAAIRGICENLGENVARHLPEYGHGIEARLTGLHETCRFDQFKSGVADRTASIRIPTNVAEDGCGYLEDRRPNANADPYRVAAAMLKTTAGLW